MIVLVEQIENGYGDDQIFLPVSASTQYIDCYAEEDVQLERRWSAIKTVNESLSKFKCHPGLDGEESTQHLIKLCSSI